MNDETDKPKSDDWGMTMPHLRLAKDENAADFSDDYAPNPYSASQPRADDWGTPRQNFNLPNNLPNNQPSSDFDKTVPNINISRDIHTDGNLASQQQSSTDDWGMTTPNVNVPRESRNDDWAPTAPNINAKQEENKPDDWGMTAPNISLPKQEKADDWSMPAPIFRISEGEKVDSLPKRSPNFNQGEANDYEKTTPNFNLSELSSAPHPFNKTSPNLNLQAQPMIANQISADQPGAAIPQAEKAPGLKLIYVLGGLIAMLFFAIVALGAAYFLFLNKPSKTNDSLKTTKRIYVAPDIASGEDNEKLVAAITGFRRAVSADDSKVKEVLQEQSK